MANNQQIEGVLRNAIQKFAYRSNKPCTDVKIIIGTKDDKDGIPEYHLQISDAEKRELKFSEIYMGMSSWMIESTAKNILAEAIRKNAVALTCKPSEIEIHVCTESEKAESIFFRLFPETTETKLSIDQIISKR